MDNNADEIRKVKILGLLGEKDYVPLTTEETAFYMSVPEDERVHYSNLISELEDEGRIVKTKKGKLQLAEKHRLFRGRLSASGKGYGFVSPDLTGGGTADDIFIPARSVNGAIHSDTVLCRVIAEAPLSGRCEGEIVKVLKRGAETIVGVFERSGKRGYVYPDDKRFPERVFIPPKLTLGAADGHKVCVSITAPPEADKLAEGKITSVLGHKNDPGVDVLSIVAAKGMPYVFPPAVTKEAGMANSEVSAEDIAGRTDFRGETTVTIDGADAKDLDDAVALSRLENGRYLLKVHIADVTHYVKRGSAVDDEAYKRGTSAYLADRVIPMLPHSLSNGICSLNAGEDRLALSCIMEIGAGGGVVRHEICESVIHVDYRMTYDIVNDMLTNTESPRRCEYSGILPMLEDMLVLAGILRQKRVNRGAIEFDFKESKISVNEHGWPTGIVPAERNAATGLIEEFMILCNETVAEEFLWRESPFIFRTHEEPSPEKLLKLNEFVKQLGYRLRGDRAKSKTVQELLSSVSATPYEVIINRVVLRGMKQARYSPDNMGHYGLASKCYCHFTSPIRRYPDLFIHRVIKDALRGGDISRYSSGLDDVCARCSHTERLAAEVEREVDTLKKIQFMSNKTGMVFEGVISSVTSWGIYVELENTVEGMISLSTLTDDHYVFDEKTQCVTGERTHTAYRPGDKLTVRVAKADPELRRLDFTLC